MDELRLLVERGLVKVAPRGGGYLITGAVNNLMLLPELERIGAVWLAREKAYYVESAEAAAEMRRLVRRTDVVANAIAARGIRAKREGAATYDRNRAAQQRKAAREIRDVYRLALMEYQAELDALKALQGKTPYGQDPAEYMRLLYRRKELESVIDELARGLANAGRAAQALTTSQLVESAAIARNIAAWQIDNMAGMRVARFVAHDTASLAVHRRYDKIAWRGVSNVAEAKRAVKQAISRGLLTGEHPGKIADRIAGLFTGQTPGSAYKRAVRIAQTETNRIMSEATQEFIRATNDGGIRCRNRWDATLDGHTRKSHRKVDGEVREVGEKFSNGARRPGDGGPAEAINCRCTLTPVLDGFAPDAPIRRDNVTGGTVPYMTYKQWEAAGGLEA